MSLPSFYGSYKKLSDNYSRKLEFFTFNYI